MAACRSSREAAIHVWQGLVGRAFLKGKHAGEEGVDGGLLSTLIFLPLDLKEAGRTFTRFRGLPVGYPDADLEVRNAPQRENRAA